jgi:chorismate dehydratase
MLAGADAALIIGDNALFAGASPEAISRAIPEPIDRLDLGAVWTDLTGLPFVYAFWVGRNHVLTPDDVRELQRARDEGVQKIDAIVDEYFADAPARRAVGASYLRDNIKYDLGADERAGLELFYQYAAEAGLVDMSQGLRFYE